ncbi:MAG: YtxH domain-containing protein [Chitinophagales bacterium]|nr:YtxH domain-containing protein [Chitinophagales bacterium]
MNSNTLSTVAAGFLTGFVLGILLAPMKGSELRQILFSNDDELEIEGLHNFNVNELTGEGSDSLEDIKRRMEQNR